MLILFPLILRLLTPAAAPARETEEFRLYKFQQAHRDKDVGTIEVGKRADLIVVDGDPLADIRNLRRVVTVVKAGRAYETARLWRMVDFQP